LLLQVATLLTYAAFGIGAACNSNRVSAESLDERTVQGPGKETTKQAEADRANNRAGDGDRGDADADGETGFVRRET